MVDTTLTDKQLTAVFGVGSQGDTPEERAHSSNSVFVRSQDHLAFWNPASSGIRLNAVEALEVFGFDKLLEVVDYGAAILPSDRKEPARTLATRRSELGLSTERLAKASQVSEASVIAAEQPDSVSDIWDLARVSIVMGLDERLIGLVPGSGGQRELAVRLRSMSQKRALSENVVATMAEAAWVIRTQLRLSRELGLAVGRESEFDPSNDYGSWDRPAWQCGYELAWRARHHLGIPTTEPIRPLRALCDRLGIPIVNVELLSGSAGATIAGATIESGEGRGILLNTAGDNENVWVRRFTIAHELGHLFWDPEDRLRSLTVDAYDELEGDARRERDYVEARANAFAIEFLAPAEAAFETYQEEGLRAVMDKFGISHSAASYHMWNAGNRITARETWVSDPSPTDSWRGEEAYTDDFSPVKIPKSRRGRFAGIVVEAEGRKLISQSTAAFYLSISEDDYRKSRQLLGDLYSLT